MLLELNLGGPFVLAAALILVFLVIDLIAAGGGMTGGMMSTPGGWVLATVPAVLVFVLVASNS